MGKFLYHYTSADAFVSMVNHAKANSNKELAFWASNVYYMNDTKEMTIVFEELERVLPKIEEVLGITENAFSKIDFLRYIENNTVIEVIKKFFYERIFREVYVISFSDQRDTLPMWSLYGSNGNGVCLVIDETKLNSTLDDNHKTKEVFYSLGDGPAFDYLKNEYRRFYDENGNNYPNKKLGFLSSVLLGLSGRVKSEAYAYEKEYRIIDHIIKMVDLGDVLANSIKEKAEPSTRCKYTSETKVRVKNGLMIPYKEFRLPIQCIDSVIIGPSVNTKLQREAMRVLLDGTHLREENIIESSIPYRSM